MMSWLTLFRIEQLGTQKLVSIETSAVWLIAGISLAVLAAYELVCVLIWGGSG